MESQLYIYRTGIIVLAVVIIIVTLILYRKKKKALIAEVQAIKERIQAEEKAAKQLLQAEEKASQERIRCGQEDLTKAQESFAKKVEEFNKEERIREDISTKSDRDIVIEMHVKTMHILEALSEMNVKLSNVHDYLEHLINVSNNVSETVNDLEETFSDSVSELSSYIGNTLENLETTICDTISENSIDLDESDIRNAVSNALDYDCYTFKKELEDTVRDAVESAIES